MQYGWWLLGMVGLLMTITAVNKYKRKKGGLPKLIKVTELNRIATLTRKTFDIC